MLPQFFKLLKLVSLYLLLHKSQRNVQHWYNGLYSLAAMRIKNWSHLVVALSIDVNFFILCFSTPDLIPLDIAIFLQRIWMPFSTFCHGLLAGVALMNLMMLYVFKPIDHEDFIMACIELSEYYKTLFFILCIICIVSVFDRYVIFSKIIFIVYFLLARILSINFYSLFRCMSAREFPRILWID